MKEIKRTEISDEWAYSGIVETGDFVFISYCMGNEEQSIENQINGAFAILGKRLELINLNLESVVKMDCLFKDIMDIHLLGKIIKERFNGKYPARKAFETKFLRDGILFQVDAIAFKGSQ
ncbi:MAG: RidA family protein [Treponema sp.]|jgi:enamine deaminase RidA (YjgF/YER057c/UK114 family)|nr:RidA family protein [Treponema sp.]